MPNSRNHNKESNSSSNQKQGISPMPNEVKKVLGLGMSITNANPIQEKIDGGHINKLIDNDFLEKKAIGVIILFMRLLVFLSAFFWYGFLKTMKIYY